MAVQGFFREGRQLCLFEHLETATRLDEALWLHSFDRHSSSLQQLSIGCPTLPISTVQTLMDLYSQPGDIILDPFAGSGSIPLEALLAERQAWAVEGNPYAWAIARGKLAAPRSLRLALQAADRLLAIAESHAATIDLDSIPAWVRCFFHPDTLGEILTVFQVLRSQPDAFLSACLLSILHHTGNSGLSYPCSPDAPYLRRGTYPPEQFPQLYEYRDVRSRLLNKIRRLYRSHRLPSDWEQRQYNIWQGNTAHLELPDASVHLILTRPPQVGGFQRVRDHRLRLWLMGVTDWQAIASSLITDLASFRAQMPHCLQEMARVLKPGGYCIFLLQDVEFQGKNRRIAETLAELANTGHSPPAQWTVETIHDRPAGRDRRATQSLRPQKLERILVLRKSRDRLLPL